MMTKVIAIVHGTTIAAISALTVLPVKSKHDRTARSEAEHDRVAHAVEGFVTRSA